MHGGAVDAAAERYGIPRDQWVDLSTGINPGPYPLPELARDYWYRLPDAALYAWLQESAAAYYGVGDPACIVPAPGSQAAIQWLPRLLDTARVAILAPTYSEHAAAWTAFGHSVDEIGADDAIPSEAGVIVVTNPNNPDGRIIEPGRLLTLAEGRLLVVDEAYADVAPEVSLARFAGRPDLVILRSVGKFFGLAGMRLGFALCGEPHAGRLRRALGPWAISGPAAAIGAVALADEGWIRTARVRLTAASSRLDGLLMRFGLRPVGGTTLYRLVADPRAAELFEHLAGNGILVRRFVDQPAWLRIGLPGEDRDFERLATVLAAWRPRPNRAGSGYARAGGGNAVG